MSKKSDDDKRSTSEMARRIWLAGIGAYGQAFTQAKGALDDVTGKSSAVFDDLVQKGQMLEMVGKKKGKDMLDKAHVPDFDIDDRIKAMRARLTRGGDDDDRIDAVESRLDSIEAKLDKLIAANTKKKPTRKASTKRATTQRTTKSKPKSKS